MTGRLRRIYRRIGRNSARVRQENFRRLARLGNEGVTAGWSSMSIGAPERCSVKPSATSHCSTTVPSALIGNVNSVAVTASRSRMTVLSVVMWSKTKSHVSSIAKLLFEGHLRIISSNMRLRCPPKQGLPWKSRMAGLPLARRRRRGGRDEAVPWKRRRRSRAMPGSRSAGGGIQRRPHF
jgi:hypothetical protein